MDTVITVLKYILTHICKYINCFGKILDFFQMHGGKMDLYREYSLDASHAGSRSEIFRKIGELKEMIENGEERRDELLFELRETKAEIERWQELANELTAALG